MLHGKQNTSHTSHQRRPQSMLSLRPMHETAAASHQSRPRGERSSSQQSGPASTPHQGQHPHAGAIPEVWEVQ